MEDNKSYKFNTIITDVEKINPLFSKCKVYIMYEGINRNNSYMSRETINSAVKSIYNIPIIGEYLIEKDNFGTHGGRIEIKDNEVKYIQTTVPYGLVPESANIYWEEVTEKDGTVRDYLVADGCILWTGRYEELNTIIEEGRYGQSMEIIASDDSGFTTIEGQEVFKINEFVFSALCILGINKDGNNPDDHVEPAFESSSIIAYSLDKDKFKLQFNQMLEELKYTMQKGGNDLTQDTNEQVETQVEEQVDTAQDFKVITEVTETTEVKTEVKTIEVEDDTENDMNDEMYNAESTESKFEEESTTTTEITEETVNTNETFEEEVKVETESTNETKEEFEETQTQVEEVETTIESDDTNEAFAELTKEYETLKVEVEELRKFKRDSELNELYSKFEGKLTKSELDNVFANNTDKSVSDIESLIFVEIGKKNFSLTQQEKQVKQPEIQISRKTEEFSNSFYSTLLEKHIDTLN